MMTRKNQKADVAFTSAFFVASINGVLATRRWYRIGIRVPEHR